METIEVHKRKKTKHQEGHNLSVENIFILGQKKSINPEDIHLFKTSVLRALSDETRQGIIVLLGKFKALCVNDIAAYFNVSRPTVSHHLNVLKEARMVKSEKHGKEMHYSLNVHGMKRAVQNLLKIIDSI